MNNTPVIAQTNQVLTEEEYKQKLETLDLEELGLKPEDQKAVLEVLKNNAKLSAADVGAFGKDLGSISAKYTDELLGLVKSKDIGLASGKLSQVVAVAQDVNAASLVLKKPTVLGRFIQKFLGIKSAWQGKFDSANEEIGRIIKEVENTQQGLNSRIMSLEKMFGSVTEEYKTLGIYIAAGEIKKDDVAREIAHYASQPQTQENSQMVYDLNSIANALEKRVSDLRVLQQSTAQTLPMIRVIQSNNAMLVQKFDAIKNITLPAWKNQISLAISLNEQRNSIRLVDQVDDATNQILRENADLLHQNSVDTAKANQRSVIDIATLEHVQNKLIATCNDVIEIQRKGEAERNESMKKLVDLQKNMKQIVLKDAENKVQ